MAEWLVERGIGEDRAALFDHDTIVAARVHWHGELLAGQILDAKLVSRRSGSARGTAMLSSGHEVLVDRLPSDSTEGSNLRVEVIRSAIGERGRLKMAHARPTDKQTNNIDLAASIESGGESVQPVHRFPGYDWEEVLADAQTGEVQFNGGSLLLATTPAMVIIDIDGTLSPRELALAAVQPIADAIRRLGIGGMVGIDFPTLAQKADRKAIDAALDDALEGWPHERTAMNGFGFVQLVARLQLPSLLHRATHSRTGLLARQLLRKAELIAEPGAILLTIHPALQAKLKPEWLKEVSRRTGREVRIAVSPDLALSGSFAQAVPL
ncbi:MAG: ribonuclease E/G [Pontixanthobacter sp.]